MRFRKLVVFNVLLLWSGLTFSGSAFLGEIRLFTGSFVPEGWVFADGASLQISSSQPLFSILGTTYGGDGRRAFSLPDLSAAERKFNGARYIVCTTGDFPSRGGATASSGHPGGGFLGEIRLFSGSFAPQGWTFANGASLSVTSNQALYSVLGTTYGGDGRRTFRLPNFRNAERMLGGAKFIISLGGEFPSRNVQANARANLVESMLGEIRLFAGSYAPQGWAYADGSTLAITQNQALFSVVGTTFGGDGRRSFDLPNLRNAERGLGGARYIVSVRGGFPERSSSAQSNARSVSPSTRMQAPRPAPVAPTHRSAAPADGVMGEVKLFAGSFAPDGWEYADGRSMPISSHRSLFAVLGTTYGGDGRVNFNLPDMRRAENGLNGLRYIINVRGAMPQR